MKSLYLSLSEEHQLAIDKIALELPHTYGPIIEVLNVQTNPSELKLSEAHLVWSVFKVTPFDVLEYLKLFKEPIDPDQISMQL